VILRTKLESGLRRSNDALQRDPAGVSRSRGRVLGISVDSHWCHAAFAKDRHLHFPLLSDFEPKGAVAKQYGAYREGEGVCEWALFVIDKQGKIFWSYRSPVAVNPGADGILEALETMNGIKSYVYTERAR
jgi:peroxiredoxin